MIPDLTRIEGIRLRLRLVRPGDADYIHGLRTDPAYNTHLSSVSGTIQDQRAWIEAYKVREAAGTEYYYVIERKDGPPCGLVRLYRVGTERLTWGSWVLDRSKPPKAALESAVLSFGVGFERLRLKVAELDVRRENSRAVAFYRRFGMRETARDDTNLYFEYLCSDYMRDRNRHMQACKGIE